MLILSHSTATLAPLVASLLAIRTCSSTTPTLPFSHLLCEFLAKMLIGKEKYNVLNRSSGNY